MRWLISLWIAVSIASAHTAPALPDSKIAPPSGQFGLPFAGKPGPNSWLLGQPYGNTVGAYRQGRSMYAAIQGIHFGMDFSAPCGTPVVAIGDGRVVEVDGSHGSPPHNLVIDHGNGLSSLYGHLLERPSIKVGTRVKRGQVVAKSGDSRFTCVSAPHLHLEIRDSSHVRLFNPIPYISADWQTLFLAGMSRAFQRDLDEPRKWQQPDRQPEARRGGAFLANFARPWPPDPSRAGPAGQFGSFPGLPKASTTLKPAAYTARPRRLTSGGCCVNPLWSPDGNTVLFIDRANSKTAYYGVSVAQPATPKALLPVAYFSPDFAYAQLPGSPSRFQRLSTNNEQSPRTNSEQSPPDDKAFTLETDGNPVLWSPDDAQMAWTVSASSGNYDVRSSQVWTASPGGTPRKLVTLYGGGLTAWLDKNTLLLSGKRNPKDALRSLETLDISTGKRQLLAQALSFRAMQVSPDGKYIVYYVAFDKPERNGLWLMTRDGQKKRLDLFGSYQWRDAKRLVYIVLEPGVKTHVLREYNVETGQSKTLTDLGTKVSNGDWQVSPDGRGVVFVNAKDRNLWVTELP
ncbi:MAG: hypothetical protein C4331_06585 [Meiothermus sp.]